MTFIAVTHTARSGTRTGIQTVTRGLACTMADAVPVGWYRRGSRFHLPKPEWARALGTAPEAPCFAPKTARDLVALLRAGGAAFRVPIEHHPLYRDAIAGSLLLLPELLDAIDAREMIATARRLGMRVAAIFHDAIPLVRPEVTARTAEEHAAYIRALNGCDVVLAVSQTSADWFAQFGGTAPVRVCRLPAEFLGAPREPAVARNGDSARMLCVSTLEPRKGHGVLLEAFRIASQKCPRLTLDIAGEPYESAPEIAAMIAAAANDPRIRWLRPSREELAVLYRGCDFTVYPSTLEGFGLPVMESLWFGRPCVCADTGPMAESARGGGCVTVAPDDASSLAEAMTLLALDFPRREALAAEAAGRPLGRWRDYAGEILRAAG